MHCLNHVVPVALVALLANGPALANDGETPPAESAAAQTVAAINQLSEAELKEFYLRCARESMRGRLSSGEIAFCSIGYERLLQHTFRGDFRALLEWRRTQGRPQQPPLASPF